MILAGDKVRISLNGECPFCDRPVTAFDRLEPIHGRVGTVVSVTGAPPSCQAAGHDYKVRYDIPILILMQLVPSGGVSKNISTGSFFAETELRKLMGSEL